VTQTEQSDPRVTMREEDGALLSTRVWRLRVPMLAVSSGPLGGGLGLRRWVVNAQVPRTYARRDPDAHLAALAREAGLDGPGVGMLTAVDVRLARTVESEGVNVDATIGVRLPQWAAADDAAVVAVPGAGTVNIVALLPERLSEAALVNAVITATEAKAQALWDAGIDGTGTASDAVCVLCPDRGEPHQFGGPRSVWGARLARAVHRAVLEGCRAEGGT
jgi:adenosylcobinamide hydrolase